MIKVTQYLVTMLLPLARGSSVGTGSPLLFFRSSDGLEQEAVPWLRTTADSCGEIPASIAENGGLVYVLMPVGVGSTAGIRLYPQNTG